MRVNSSQMIQNVNQIGAQDKNLRKIYEKLATGKNINNASDNASMLAMAKELEKQTRGLKQSDSNIGDALGALSIAEGTGNEVSSMLQRQRELSIQAQNGTLNNDDRKALNQEYQALSQEMTRISKAANYNGQGVADGSSALSDGTGVVQAGAGANDKRTLNKVDFSNAGSGDISTAQGAAQALKSIDSSIKNVSSTRASIGSQMNALEHTQNNARNMNIQQTAALSQVEDLDYAQGVMDKSRAELLSQSSRQAAANFNSIAKSNMSALMQG